ncbi:hypothetical protein FAM09_21640 [Niastella caeni]|uniref:Uncharacterized protein n=1 Tax=Niastella caeni TaxID=2569763 RepID=A0A4S8HQ00_9BACT|nr:hypothetical protein [Niastella caeni]THU35994.1 hypothetical protein FAM09_21640 [Niastella caeni]
MKKFKVHFLLIVAFLVLTTACKKQNMDAAFTHPDTNEKIQVKLTGEEQEMLADILGTKGVKDATDFRNKVNYVKAKCTNQRSARSSAATAVTDDGSEEISVGDFQTLGLTELHEWDIDYSIMSNILSQYPTGIKVYKGVGIVYATFAIRGNQILFNVPYTVAMNNSSNPVIVKVAAMPSAPPSMQPVGAHWGTYSASPYPAYVQSFGTSSASVHAQGTEMRTQVFSMEGKVKISTETDLEVFKAGVELEAGFTIESAQNIYNQYILQGTFTVQLLSPGGDNWLPVFNFASSLKALQYGILRNR